MMKQELPPFSIEHFFAGYTQAWGVFEDRFGQLRRSFRVDIEGENIENGIRLNEQFYYSDGTQDQRIWEIHPAGPQSYIGHADDIIGCAKGQVSGTKLSWKYKMKLNIGGKQISVTFDDNMYLQSDGVMINIAKVRKYGVLLGTVTLFFCKQPL
jgi:hypothetical protein